jgi:hypothetical protein
VYFDLTPNQPVLFRVTNSEAVCGNGEVANYLLRRAPDESNTTTWVIRFDGNGLCYNDVSCLERNLSKPETMRPLPSRDKTPFDQWMDQTGGVLSADRHLNPSFYNLNAVFMHHCSSDSWMGNANVDKNGHSFYLRGQDIAISIFKDLLELRGMKEARNILISAPGSGALGVTYLLPELFDLVKIYAPFAKLSIVNDGGWLLLNSPQYQYPPPGWGSCTNSTNCPLQSSAGSPGQLERLAIFANITVPTACSADTQYNYSWQCLFSDVAFSYLNETLRSAVLVVQQQYDATLLLMVRTILPRLLN